MLEHSFWDGQVGKVDRAVVVGGEALPICVKLLTATMKPRKQLGKVNYMLWVHDTMFYNCNSSLFVRELRWL